MKKPYRNILFVSLEGKPFEKMEDAPLRSHRLLNSSLRARCGVPPTSYDLLVREVRESALNNTGYATAHDCPPEIGYFLCYETKVSYTPIFQFILFIFFVW